VAGGLKTLGIEAIILDAAAQEGAGASGNPAGIVVPFLTVGDMVGMRLSISSLADTRAFLEAHDLILSNGVISLDYDKRKSTRQKKIADQGFPSDLATYKSADELSATSGLPVKSGGLLFETGAVIQPRQLSGQLAEGVERIYGAQLHTISGEEGAWIAHCMDGRTFMADHVVLCSGADFPELLETIGYDLGVYQVTSGQLSILPKTTELAALQIALNYSGYTTPLIEGQQYLGAGFDPTADTAVSQKGHLYNLELMPVELRELAGEPSKWQGRTSRRLAYPDRLPLAGEITPGLSVVSALGARGLTLARLIGKSVAHEIAGRPSILPYQIMMALHPQRFFDKAL
ncbi:MAG: FAD-dependent oxidoreductase, partial [Candidatus Puniceispirillaceae bacterium]